MDFNGKTEILRQNTPRTFVRDQRNLKMEAACSTFLKMEVIYSPQRW
jgi:hypothetical protein